MDEKKKMDLSMFTYKNYFIDNIYFKLIKFLRNNGLEMITIVHQDSIKQSSHFNLLILCHQQEFHKVSIF